MDEQELLNAVRRRREQVAAEPEQVAVPRVQAGDPAEPIACTSLATATLDTVARPM